MQLYIIKCIACTSLFSILLQSAGFCQVQHPTLEFEAVYTGLSSPVDLADADDGTDRLFVVEQGGVIKIIDNGSVLPDPFLDISSIVLSGGERGLLGLCFHPDYASNGQFFVHYTDSVGDSQISRFNRSAGDINEADPDSEFPIMRVSQPYANHNGGCMRFGPDGYLYIAFGDGGSGGDPENRAQDGSTVLGKMLRIDIDQGPPYSIPDDNPFVGDPNTMDEIWAFGLRNPWRFSFDRVTGDLWIGDVGQGAREEVSYQPASSNGGENYGWRCYEGDNTYDTANCGLSSNYIFPVFDYDRDSETGGRCVSGGIVYRGSSYSCLYGFYVFADYATENVWTIGPDSSVLRHDISSISSIAGFGEDESGELYAVGRGGTIYLVKGSTEVISGNPIPEQTHRASGHIISDGTVSEGTNVIFQAGKTIELQPGFEVMLNAIFNSYIGCN